MAAIKDITVTCNTYYSHLQYSHLYTHALYTQPRERERESAIHKQRRSTNQARNKNRSFSRADRRLEIQDQINQKQMELDRVISMLFWFDKLGF